MFIFFSVMRILQINRRGVPLAQQLARYLFRSCIFRVVDILN